MSNTPKTKPENNLDYKDAIIQAHEKSINYLLWALGITSFTFIGTVIYLLFQDHKEYEKAIEEIRYYRNEAQITSQKINESGNVAIKAVQEKGNEAVDFIKKQTVSDLEKIKAEVIVYKNKLENQSKITELWFKILDTVNTNEPEEGIKYLTQLLSIDNNNWLAYDHLGSCYNAIANKRYENNIEKKKEYLLNAKDAFIKASELNDNISAVNIADISAFLDNEEDCKIWLIKAEDSNMLPTIGDAMQLQYLPKYSSKDWFKKLIWKTY